MSAQRLARMRSTLEHRQPDLTVMMDNVYKTHNLAAIVRSCDAVGIPEVHAYSPSGQVRQHRHTSSGSSRWVSVTPHDSVTEGVTAFREQHAGAQVIAAHLSDSAVHYLEVDFTKPTMILMGTELEGPSEESLALADQHVVIPMVGLVESLNVSVATALLLFEAKRQREVAGLYDKPHYDEAYMQKTIFEWLHPTVADYCRRHGQPYPDIDADGHVVSLKK